MCRVPAQRRAPPEIALVDACCFEGILLEPFFCFEGILLEALEQVAQMCIDKQALCFDTVCPAAAHDAAAASASAACVSKSRSD
tara:strand:- start:394 stop:645 length:252 start_codon:yes stop_codon:yes gene_type:complete